MNIDLLKQKLSNETIKYLFFGSLNIFIGWVIYFVNYNYIIEKENVEIFDFLTISPHIFSLLSTFPFTFFMGYFFNYYFVFKYKTDNMGKSMYRYFIACMGSIVINYILLKLFVDLFGWYPTPSQILTTCLVTLYSFSMQKRFTFKTVPIK
ncbi:GtrA family protein [Sphingobacterium hungaricum]|uniref:Phenylalanine 4-monooxygenase n=1 Tax=Sphingobacterium hungaricum TaxID=2082723 RepID=A0A928USP8_9SPHI|nr:GtrA family protein [Sphingobacterium hungaricum]MBE8712606.1 phenylalanine 4-monooxygenase [Sphingobacterium hungaricum]